MMAMQLENGEFAFSLHETVGATEALPRANYRATAIKNWMMSNSTGWYRCPVPRGDNVRL